MTDQPAGIALGCELKVQREGSRLALSFVLANRSSRPATVRYFRPFLQFELRVTANGRELSVSQPDIDMPVQPQELQIPDGGQANLDTPIRLRFASEGGTADDADRWVWTIAGEPAPIELRATLRLDGVSVPPCIARA